MSKITLSNGDEIEIVESRLKAPGLVEGKHLILHFNPDKKVWDVPDKEAADALAVALKVAKEECFEPDRFRILINGFGLCKRNDFHIHIILPTKNDELPPIVDRSGSH